MGLKRYRGRHLRPRPKKRGPVVVATAAAISLPSTAHAGVHVVRRGETLSGIARRYNTTVTRLAHANNLSNANLILAGQRLRIPGGVYFSGNHTVRSGETLSAIAGRYGTTVASLARRNHLANPNFIVAGQRLRVPGRGGAMPVAARAPAPASTSTIQSSLHHQAHAHGVDSSLVKAVGWQESGWRQDVVSSAGAIGVMQVMPDTARYVNRVLGGGSLNVRRADDNVHLGVMYLRHMLNRFPSVAKALAGYYSGPRNVGRRLKSYQRPYVKSVLSLRERFR